MSGLRFRLGREGDFTVVEHWLLQRPGKPFPPAKRLIPPSSTFCAADEVTDAPVAIAVYHVCGDAAVAMLSWLFTDPGAGIFRAHEAATLAIRGGLFCLDRQGVSMILSRLSTRGAAKILAREGFTPTMEVKTEMGRIRQF